MLGMPEKHCRLSMLLVIYDGGRACSDGRVATTPEELELFARSLASDDRVVAEATGNALAIARIRPPPAALLAFAPHHRALHRLVPDAMIHAARPRGADGHGQPSRCDCADGRLRGGQSRGVRDDAVGVDAAEPGRTDARVVRQRAAGRLVVRACALPCGCDEGVP